MKTDGRPSSPWLGLGLIGTGLALAAGGVYVKSATGEVPPPTDFNRAGAETRARIEQALGSEAREFETKAFTAARTGELIAALNMGADRATFQDLLESEQWWAPVRVKFPLNGVVTAQGTLALLSPGSGDAVTADALRLAGDREIASGLVAGGGRAFLAATARVTRTTRAGAPPLVLVGAPLDHGVLAKTAELTGDAIGLCDQTKLLELAGPGEPGRALAPLVGQKDGSIVPLEDHRLGMAWPIGGGLRLVAAFTPPPAPVAAAPAPSWLALVVAGAAAALMGLVVATRRRPRNAGTQGPVSGTARAEGEAPVRITRTTPGLTTRAPLGAGTGDGTTAGPRMTPRTPRHTLPQSSEEPVRTRQFQAVGVSSGGTAAVATRMENDPEGGARPGQMGRYRLIERIGEGGMAEIFFAVAHGAEAFVRYFVVKRMHPHVARSRVAVTQFIDEAQLQARLVHSNIVPVFDFGKAGDEYFLALEYIHGKDLQHLIQRHLEYFGRPLDLPMAFFIMHEVLEGLSFAHSQTERDGRPSDIVHRDISPGNVLISYRGEVKLTDFGIAKSDNRVSSTEVGMVKGNAGFMSPEQARGDVVDRRSDLFSAGAVLHYCLTGHLLYDGETTMNRLLRAAVGPATAQFGQIDKLALPAAQVLRRALTLDVGKRYQSASEFARELSEQMSDRSALNALMDVLFPVPERRDLR